MRKVPGARGSGLGTRGSGLGARGSGLGARGSGAYSVSSPKSRAPGIRCAVMKALTALKTAGAVAAIVILASFATAIGAQRKPAPPASVRVYVFDCGKLEGGDPSRFSLKREEMKTTDMSVACYLVVHPRGTLMWDVGAVPDADVTSPGTATRYHLVLPNGNERFVTTTQTLKAQLAGA